MFPRSSSLSRNSPSSLLVSQQNLLFATGPVHPHISPGIQSLRNAGMQDMVGSVAWVRTIPFSPFVFRFFNLVLPIRPLVRHCSVAPIHVSRLRPSANGSMTMLDEFLRTSTSAQNSLAISQYPGGMHRARYPFHPCFRNRKRRRILWTVDGRRQSAEAHKLSCSGYTLNVLSLGCVDIFACF